MTFLYNHIFVDVSQFVAEPLRTGVQRVLTQVTRHMPRERLMPFRVMGPERVGILDPVLFDLMLQYFDSDTPTVRSRLARAQGGEFLRETMEEAKVRLVGNRPLAVLPAQKFFRRALAILNLENFSDSNRSRFYIGCRENFRFKIYHLIHDFLLFEHPELFPQLDWRKASDYVKLFEAYSLAGGFFVSNPGLKARVERYFSRGPDDVHLVPFGGDIRGEPPVAADYSQSQRRVVVLGTIEPRKFPEETITALDHVAQQANGGVDCVVVGRWGWVEPDAKTRIADIFRHGRVRHMENISDAEVTDLMASTDVAVSLSIAEGFGIPVVEFAARGIPVVSNDGVPAVEVIPPELLVRVEDFSPQTIAAAVRAGLDRGVSPSVRYTATWADCAAEIMRVLEERVVAVSTFNPLAGMVGAWDVTARLAKTFERQPREWEELKVAVQSRLNELLTQSAILVADQNGEPVAAVPRLLVEELSEVVSDNRGLRYWNEIEQARPLVAQMLRCVLSDNYIECLRRAYRTFLGRSIDPRAAAEVPTYAPLGRALGRVREIAFSPEAENFLGGERALALRKVVSDVGPLLDAIVAEHFDLFHIYAALDIGEPALPDVFESTALLTEGVSPLEVALYVARRRPLRSDMVSVFLEVLAEVFEHRGLRIKAAYAARDLTADDDSQSFLRRAYRLLLRKEIDDEGMAYYQSALRDGRLTREDVIGILGRAEEAKSRRISVV